MIELTLPLPKNRANARTHWAVAAKQKKAYVASCEDAINTAFNGVSYHGCVVISMDFFVWSLNDWDNLVNRAKWAWDALVQCGVLHDDSPKYVALGAVTQTVDRKNQRLILKIEEQSDGKE